ncbi:MAG: hypothetical protein GQ564_17595 [Bacteroidales bacterium]|nr:hypothetical protein [Bacteroidales bacterium]
MRTKLLLKILFVSAIAIIFQDTSTAQDNSGSCKVLLESISKEYAGKCKDGLAHGKGIASGIDVYEGKFKKGLPHGKGKYTWASGSYYSGSWKNGLKSGNGLLYSSDTKKIIKGVWKDDAFYKEIVDPPYVVTLKTGVTGVNFYEDDLKIPHQVEIVFQKDGNQARSVPELNISSTSGQSSVGSSFSGFKNVQFPFEGTVEFMDLSRMGTTVIRYALSFKLTKASSWKVVIRY